MDIGIERLSDSTSITAFPWFRFDLPSASGPRLEPVDVTAPIDRPGEPDPTGDRDHADPIRDARRHDERGRHEACPSKGRERLEATNARIHVATGGEPATAGFGIFTNETTSAATLVALQSPAFDHVEMRETFAIGDVTMMRKTERLTVLPGDSVEFSALGRRLMMTGLRQPLEEGQLIGITMLFESGRPRVVPFRVVANES